MSVLDDIIDYSLYELINETEDDCFSDQEEDNKLKRHSVLADMYDKKISEVKIETETKKLLNQMSEYKNKTNSKGIWMADSGMIRVEDMEDTHLVSIPRFLIRNGRVSNIDEVPKFILDEIKERGFVIKRNGYVQR